MGRSLFSKTLIWKSTNMVKKIQIETHTAKAEKELWKLFNSMGWKCEKFSHGGIRKTEYGSFGFIDVVQTWINSSLDCSVSLNSPKTDCMAVFFIVSWSS